MPPPGDLSNQGMKPGLLRCRQILHCRSHQGSDEINTVKIFAMISSVLSGGIEPHLSLEGMVNSGSPSQGAHNLAWIQILLYCGNSLVEKKKGILTRNIYWALTISWVAILKYPSLQWPWSYAIMTPIKQIKVKAQRGQPNCSRLFS